jgi:hypothetical protein
MASYEEIMKDYVLHYLGLVFLAKIVIMVGQFMWKVGKGEIGHRHCPWCVFVIAFFFFDSHAVTNWNNEDYIESIFFFISKPHSSHSLSQF